MTVQFKTPPTIRLPYNRIEISHPRPGITRVAFFYGDDLLAWQQVTAADGEVVTFEGMEGTLELKAVAA